VLNRYGRRLKSLTGGVQKVWIGTTIDGCFKKWFDKKELKEVRAVPCVLCWGFGWLEILPFLNHIWGWCFSFKL